MFNTAQAWLGSIYARIITMDRNQEGQAAVEYALILALISIVGIAAFFLIGTDLKTQLDKVTAAF